MNVSHAHTDMDNFEKRKGIDVGIYQRIRSLAHKIMSSFKGIGALCKFINQTGLERTLWVLTYMGKTLGGDISVKRKLPFDRNLNPLPWYTYPGIEYLQQFDFTGCTVFEYGSGNSSRFWSNLARSVVSIESDPDWYQTGLQYLSPNRTLLLKTEKDEYVNAIHHGDVQYEIIVIDGEYRFNCAIEAMTRVKKGGFILLDNSDWFPGTARFLRESGFSQVDFIGAGPINSYAWCTSLFFRDPVTIPRINDSEPVRIWGGLAQISAMDNP